MIISIIYNLFHHAIIFLGAVADVMKFQLSVKLRKNWFSSHYMNYYAIDITYSITYPRKYVCTIRVHRDKILTKCFSYYCIF